VIFGGMIPTICPTSMVAPIQFGKKQVVYANYFANLSVAVDLI
jgi:hypothetical protein